MIRSTMRPHVRCCRSGGRGRDISTTNAIPTFVHLLKTWINNSVQREFPHLGHDPLVPGSGMQPLHLGLGAMPAGQSGGVFDQRFQRSRCAGRGQIYPGEQRALGHQEYRTRVNDSFYFLASTYLIFPFCSYMGKSTGQGGLGLWMHNLNAIEVLSDYSSPNYHGPALKLGAGVVTSAAYETANQHGLRIVGGDCPSVGIAGGFTQGGGHSVLSSQYGLGADQVVEWEVVTATGVHLIASPSQNTDLYWALSGGGPGTYGVVISMTVRAHSDAGVVGGASLSLSSTGLAPSIYWGAIRQWHEMLLPMTNAGATVNYLVTSSALTVEAITLVNGTADDIHTLLQPFLVYLNRSNVTQAAYTVNMTTSTDFLSHYLRYFGPLPDGAFATAQLIGGRLVPRSILQNPSSLSELMTLVQNITVSTPFYVVGFAANLSITASRSPIAFNAVLPAWRDTGVSLILPSVWNFTLPRSVEVQRELQLTKKLEPQLRKLTPGSGGYLNEANFMLRTWKEDFYGANYERLRAIKKKYDPEDLFYAHSAVGSDVWTVADNGRMCRS